MKHVRTSIAVGAFAAVFAACGGGDAGTLPFRGGSGTAGATAAATGASGSGAPGAAPPGMCMPGVPATSQIPRLLNRQYDAVVRDLLGVTNVAATTNRRRCCWSPTPMGR